MSHCILGDPGNISHTLKYIITHVFCPLGLPDSDDHSIENDHSLAKAIATTARLYACYVDQANLPQWHSIVRMLENLQVMTQAGSLDTLQAISQFSSMHVGDILAMHIRAQNAGVVFRKQKDVTIFEVFELSPMAKDVMTTEGRLICSYPGPAIEVPNAVFGDKDFLSELVNFIVHMNHDRLDATDQTSRKEELDESVFKDTFHPHYITELLTGILRSVGHPANITRISKRVGDDVIGNNSKPPWRRSSLWLLIRVSLQTTLDQSPLGHDTYKQYMLFFMCCLAREKASADLASDLLQFMSTKISRRLRKLGSFAPDWLSRTVVQTCTSLRSTIETRWKQAQAAQRVSPLWDPSQLDLTRDIHLSLLHTGDYLRNTLPSHSINIPNVPFVPRHRPRGTLDDFLSSDADLLDEAYRLEPHVTLYDIEQAVERGIDTWVDGVTNNEEACAKLEMLGDNYSSGALKTYASNPELLSVMLLTTIELWIALDKVVIKEIPMLADYSPALPTSLLEHLLLCKTASFHRLRHAHAYLSRRHLHSRNPSVFSSTTTVDSFAVRFYRKSPHLQHLKRHIEKVAQDEVCDKVAELQELSMNAHLSPYDPTRISVHEWPLPANKLEAETVVFELDCPKSFNVWRTAIIHLLVDLCSPFVQRDVPSVQLNNYHALQCYFVEHPRSRISLGSKPSASVASLYIPAKRKDVCVKNGLSFYTFDTRTGIPISEALGRYDNGAHYTYKLPRGPYQNLQKYVDSTFHTSNEVVANQVDCHKMLFIHEYMAFGHLRSGGLLQWLNILRELRGRSLRFRRPEVHMLLAQAASEVGPLADTGWTWHQDIQQSAFCHALLGELRSLIREVEANWLEAVTMDTISFLLRRLLVSSPDEAISIEALGLLRTVRDKVFSWVEELSARSIKTTGDDGCRENLRDTAAICRSTFDVDPEIISKLLRSPEDVEILLSSAMIIHDLMPSDVSRLPIYSQLLLHRDRHLSLALESVISDIMSDSSNQGINLAVGRIWPGYHAGSTWIGLPHPNSRWFSCTTAQVADRHPHTVHFNTLDGSLFVDGKPFGNWLPNEFVQHSLYQLIFGEQMLKVMAGDLRGMEYSTRNLISDHRVYFSLKNNRSDLIIRAKPNTTEPSDSGILELVPHGKIEGDFPTVLIKGYAHWLNLSTSIMEIRPLDNIWVSSSENWKVDCTPGNYRMWKGHELLVDIRSQSWDMVSSLLRPLGTPQDLIVSVSPGIPGPSQPTLQLSVFLPRYDLSFYVDPDGDLQSGNMRGMVYDKDQSIGTLFGLVNQLVLRPKGNNPDAMELTPRCVLIPDGDVSFRVEGHHVHVKITPAHPIKQVMYQTYTVNIDLNCLTGDYSLTSKLYLAYLHALTSGCSVDPLTGRSGTEEALSILRSARCWSTTKFDSRDAELLSSIASICPLRTWHVKQSVQKVEWLDLPKLSQNHELYITSKAIKEHYERRQLFYKSQSSQSFPLRDDHLLKRSARRAAHLLPWDSCGLFPHADSLDVRYTARDAANVASGEHRAYTAATYVRYRIAMNIKDNNIWSMLRSSIREVSTENALSLRYNSSWLAPNIPMLWLSAYNLLRQCDESDKWPQLRFSLPAMAYTSSDLSELVPVFIAFALYPHFRFEDPPKYDFYPIAEGCDPSFDVLRSYVVDCAYPFEHSPECLEHVPFLFKTAIGLQYYRHKKYDRRLRSDANAAAQKFLDAWPASWPREDCPPCSLDPNLYDVTNLEDKVMRHFSNRFRNLELKKHLTCVQEILNKLHSEATLTPVSPPYLIQPSQSIPSRIAWPLTIDQLFTRSAPSLQERNPLSLYAPEARNTSPPDSASLFQLIATVEGKAGNSFQHQYALALRTSAEFFGSETALSDYETMKLPSERTLLDHYTWCRTNYIDALHHLQRHLGPKSYSEQAVEQSGQWPRITAHTLFRSIASNSPIVPPEDWKKCLVRFTHLALELQRARRLLLLHYDDLRAELCRELQNEGCDGWASESYPDWLLIQLQGNFLIRRVQADVANQMMAPQSDENMAMQLNMGEGKTSVIVPIVVAALANGDQLVRVIVPKPLIPQTLHLLTDRLGGLTNRRIYYLPFSRSLELDDQKVASLHRIILECMQERGVLVLQPEHVLSLKLVSVEKQLPRSNVKDGQVGRLSLDLQRWLDSHSRDVLDESDEILDVRSQLIFTLGDQQQVEGHPERWTTTQQVLALVSERASSLRERFPLGVEYEPGPPGSFPYLRILQADAGETLISQMVEDVLDGHLPNIKLHPHSSRRDAIRSFISCKNVSPDTVRLVKECTGLWSGLLLLRGLLVNGIISITFRERRWRVDYGLAPERTMLAVPYRAKDVPAQRAEFGHPDVAIILTCLSYYYGGLSEEQLNLSFRILLRQHDPSLDYDLWVRAYPAMPESLPTVTSINIDSLEQWNKTLFPLFSRNRATIDFYLSRVVFPREAKEFPSKLSSSGWDLAERKERLVTGFSGTNDGQYLLPIHITQRDPDHQRGTNAKVLSYLLQPENNHYMCMVDRNGKQLNINDFLHILVAQTPEIRVLLDVGAQMLDLQNYDLAKAWLDITPNVSAAIYFSEDDELMVCTRDSSAQLLQSSSFAQQLDRCVVYLDDAHTRGTDIRFPNGFRAAVTLGPKMNKDRLVQGCMRMRKLGHAHSIMFFAPLDVDRHIRFVAGKDKDPSSLNVIETKDILHWAIRETWQNIQRWAPHWVQQGMDHASRYTAWTSFREGRLTSEELLEKWLQPEAKKLEELYEPRNALNPSDLTNPNIRQRGRDLGVLSLWSVGLDEEQERELVYEVKREREVERPPSVRAADHSVHPDVTCFVKTGVIPSRTRVKPSRTRAKLVAQTKAFCPAFETLQTTSAAIDGPRVWSRPILATIDFGETVKVSGKMDDYLRPVHWILSAKEDADDVLVILSSYEVNILLPDIRASKKVHLHLYTPRITKSMKPCDDLALYSIPAVPIGWIPPPLLMDQLNVFAGQLYLKDYETYIRLCRFLSLHTRELLDKEGIVVEPDGFIPPVNRTARLSQAQPSSSHTFANTPIVSLKALMNLRNRDIDFAPTHMGKLVHAHLLSETDFDD